MKFAKFSVIFTKKKGHLEISGQQFSAGIFRKNHILFQILEFW